MKVITVVAIICVLFVSSAFAENAATKPIVIGVVTDLSGPAVYWGKQTQIGAQLAVEDLKNEGVFVSVLIEDGALDTKKSLSAAQNLVSRSKASALYVDFTPPAMAITTLSKNSRKLFVYAAAAPSILDTNPYAFKTYTDYTEGCRKIAEYWKAQDVTSVGVMRAISEFGDRCALGVTEVFKDAFIADYDLSGDQRTQVLLMKSHGIKALVNASFEADVLNTLSALTSADYKVLIGTNEECITNTFIEKYSSMLDGTVTFGLPRASDGLIERAKPLDKTNSLSTFEGVNLAYLHIKQIARALLTCGPANTECAVKEMSNSKSDPATGFMGWRNRVASLKTIIKVFKNGRFQAVNE